MSLKETWGHLNANLREQYRDTEWLEQNTKSCYKIRKKNDYPNSKITGLKKKCRGLGQMDDTRKDKDDIPSISEDNW